MRLRWLVPTLLWASVSVLYLAGCVSEELVIAQSGGEGGSTRSPCGGGWEEDELSVEQSVKCEVKIFSCSRLNDEGCSPNDTGWIDPSCFKKNARVLDSEGDVIADFEGDDAEVVDLVHPSVELVLLVRKFGGSKHWLRYILYLSDPELKNPVEINTPINKYQANKRKGSEYEPDGFYQDRQGNILIDILVRLPGARSNAAAEHEVETLKLSMDGLTSLGRRDFDIDSYRPYGQTGEDPARG